MTPEELSSHVNKWLFSDFGPFGWNDHAKFQDRFNKMPKEDRLKFIKSLCNELRKNLVKREIEIK